MNSNRPTVFVVDEDFSVRKGLEQMLLHKGYFVQCFTSAEEFLKENNDAQIACIVIEVNLPGLNGLELQSFLLQRGNFFPIVFMTGQADIATVVRAIRSGAISFLAKPFAEGELIAEIEKAFTVCRNEQHHRSEIADIKSRYGTLTPRESEILSHVVSGKLNKQTASQLGIAEDTVKVHRRRVMRKMQAKSIAELVLMAYKLHVLSDHFEPVEMANAPLPSNGAPERMLHQVVMTRSPSTF